MVTDLAPKAAQTFESNTIGMSITSGPVSEERIPISSKLALILVSMSVVLPGLGLLKVRRSLWTLTFTSMHDRPSFLQPWALMPISPEKVMQIPDVQGAAGRSLNEIALRLKTLESSRDSKSKFFMILFFWCVETAFTGLQYDPDR